MPDNNTEIKAELKEVIKSMQQQHVTQVEILAELKVVKPRVEKLEEEVEKIKTFVYKSLGIVGAITFLGAPTTAAILIFIAKAH